MNTLSPFPVGEGQVPATPSALQAQGYALRRALDADLPRLHELYADTRAEEMSGVPWPPAALQGFLDQQFALQHQHYVHHYAGAHFLVIEHQGVVQGRYYLLRTDPAHVVIDICLMAAHRGHGVGRALIEQAQREAALLGRGMDLHVLQSNPRARKLYESLGFETCDSTQTHLRMRWRGQAGAPS